MTYHVTVICWNHVFSADWYTVTISDISDKVLGKETVEERNRLFFCANVLFQIFKFEFQTADRRLTTSELVYQRNSLSGIFIYNFLFLSFCILLEPYRLSILIFVAHVIFHIIEKKK